MAEWTEPVLLPGDKALLVDDKFVYTAEDCCCGYSACAAPGSPPDYIDITFYLIVACTECHGTPGGATRSWVMASLTVNKTFNLFTSGVDSYSLTTTPTIGAATYGVFHYWDTSDTCDSDPDEVANMDTMAIEVVMNEVTGEIVLISATISGTGYPHSAVVFGFNTPPELFWCEQIDNELTCDSSESGPGGGGGYAVIRPV